MPIVTPRDKDAHWIIRRTSRPGTVTAHCLEPVQGVMMDHYISLKVATRADHLPDADQHNDALDTIRRHIQADSPHYVPSAPYEGLEDDVIEVWASHFFVAPGSVKEAAE